MLAGLGTGVAASAAGLWYYKSSAPPLDANQKFTLVSVYGQVATVGRGTHTDVAVGDAFPPGETLATFGTNSMAVVGRPDGSTITLAADSAVTLNNSGIRLKVLQGAVQAYFRPPIPGGPLLTLFTTLAAVNTLGGAVMTLCADESATQVQVQHGRVDVSDRLGGSVDQVASGELLTIREGGERVKERVTQTPDKYQLDLVDPLPEGWHVGHRAETDQGPVLVPEWWFDPYHSAVLSQIRSHKPWTRGLMRLLPDSVMTVRYRADRGGRGQACLCVRTERTTKASTGVLEWNGRYEGCEPGEWKTLEVRIGDMLNNKEAPTFSAPWVGFLLIFNTYAEDIGLRVADFRVSRPGGPADG